MIEDILKRLEIAWKLNALEPTPFDEDDDLIIAKKNIFEIFRQELTALEGEIEKLEKEYVGNLYDKENRDNEGLLIWCEGAIEALVCLQYRLKKIK